MLSGLSGPDPAPATASAESPGLLARARGKLSMALWAPVIRRMPEGVRDVGISFDDGPTPETTRAIIALLREHDASATFFVNGPRASDHPDLINALVAAGHDVQSHGWDHVPHDRLTAEDVIASMERTERALRKFRPTPSPYLVRLPYGAGHAASDVHRALRAWRPDVQLVHWHYDTRDWTLAEGCDDLASLRVRCDATVAATLARPDLPGSILLMHERPIDVTAPLAAAVAPMFVDALLERLCSRGLSARRVPPVPSQTLLRRFVRG